MEYIEFGVPINRSPLLRPYRDRWTEELQHLADKLHAEGPAHGDLRTENILCKEDSLMLVDFDWGGNDREVFYCTGILDDELLKGMV